MTLVVTMLFSLFAPALGVTQVPLFSSPQVPVDAHNVAASPAPATVWTNMESAEMNTTASQLTPEYDEHVNT